MRVLLVSLLEEMGLIPIPVRFDFLPALPCLALPALPAMEKRLRIRMRCFSIG